MREDSMTPQEREQRKSKRDAQDRALWDIAAKVTDTSPIDNKQQSKKDEFDILDMMIQSLRWGFEEGKERELALERKKMVEKNIEHAIPELSDEQLKYFHNLYEKKMKFLKETKIDKKQELNEMEKDTVKIYKCVQVEIERRNINIQDKKNGSKKNINRNKK